MHTIQKIRHFRVASYLFPDLSGDKGWVDYHHIKGAMQICWDVLGLVEIVEYESWVLVELLVKLQSVLFEYCGLRRRP